MGKGSRKPYEEIGAIFNGNEVKIRVPKSTSKPPKLSPSQLKLHQQCTCDDEGSICSETCGQPDDDGAVGIFGKNETAVYQVSTVGGGPAGAEFGGGNTNQLNFQIPDDICEALTNRTNLNSELTYSEKKGHNYLCNTCNVGSLPKSSQGGKATFPQNIVNYQVADLINVTPKDAPKDVKAQKVLRPDKDIFILKIGKQTDEPNRTGNIEVELITPRAPAKPKPATHSCVQIQCNEENIPNCVPCRTCRAPMPKKKRGKRQKCCY